MLIGAMNHPRENVIQEILWMAELGLGFIDLTLEPPAAAAWKVDAAGIRSCLRDAGLEVVGHTAYYLPLASPFESLRRAGVQELLRCADLFAAVGAKWMNLHPDRHVPMHDRAFVIDRNLQSIREVMEGAASAGVGVMVENLPGDFNTVDQLGQLLIPLPELGLHLDLGHANLQTHVNTGELLIAAYGRRLRHVHLHDNKGGSADLHLPLGAGSLDLMRHIRALRRAGYDGTITLEVFSTDRSYLIHSRDVLLRAWNEAGG